MRAWDSVDRPCGFFVTESGKQPLTGTEECACTELLVQNGLYACWECGTVYAVVYGFNRLPRRSHWRVGRAAR